MDPHDMHSAALFAPDTATHVARTSGDWSDPAVWGGDVPGDGARVLIPDGTRILYDVDTEARIDMVRVDGRLDFATNADTVLYVDTLVTTPDSHLTIGEAGRPVARGVEARVVITADGPDPRGRSWDPEQLSRGILAEGRVDIAGAAKDAHMALAGDARAGDGVLRLAERPQGWAAGDTIVLAGTETDPRGSDADNGRFHDEVLRITAIDGTQIRFQNLTGEDGGTTLLWDHARPQGFAGEGLTIHVANLSRNVTIASEAGPDAALQDRGHVMFMHEADVDVGHAAFVDLGRSDKSREVDDVGRNVDGSDGGGANIRGRYPVHLHRLSDAEDPGSDPARVEGVAVWGSPGWGISHHDSHADLLGNVVFDVAGAGIAAEAGGEIGLWRDNLVIKATAPGVSPFEDGEDRAPIFDGGFEGDGYWVQGAAQVAMVDNAAASLAGAGLNLFSSIDGLTQPRDVRDTKTVPIQILDQSRGVDWREAAQGQRIDVSEVPLRQLQGLEVYNAATGIEMWGHMRAPDGTHHFTRPTGGAHHDERSTIEDFRLWGITEHGIRTFYTNNVDFVDGLVHGDIDTPELAYRANAPSFGAGVSHNRFSEGLHFDEMHIEGFRRAFHVLASGEQGPGGVTPYGDADGEGREDWHYDPFRLEDSTLADNQVAFFFNDQGNPRVNAFPGFFELIDTNVEARAGNRAPEAAFDHDSFGPNGVLLLDATSSLDPDRFAGLPGGRASRAEGNGIVSYAWDFGADGDMDAYGATAVWASGPGTHDVRLTVTDADGAAGTATRRLGPELSGPVEVLADPGLGRVVHDFAHETEEAGTGWRGVGFTGGGNGLSTSNRDGLAKGVTDLAESRGTHVGPGRFELSLTNRDGDGRVNRATVEVIGIEGRIEARTNRLDDLRAGTFDADKNVSVLLRETVTLSEGRRDLAFDIDFGGGHDWILTRITSPRIDAVDGDRLVLHEASLLNHARGDGASAPRPSEPEPDPQTPDGGSGSDGGGAYDGPGGSGTDGEADGSSGSGGEADGSPDAGTVAINIGSNQSVTAADGTTYAADATGVGRTYATGAAIAGTADDTLYQSEAWSPGGLSYDFALARGTYAVTLHFAEIYGGASRDGARVFDVRLEGETVLDDLDIHAEVGANAALVRTLTAEVTDGTLDLDLAASVENPKLSAIRIAAADSGSDGGSAGSGDPAPAPAPAPEDGGATFGDLGLYDTRSDRVIAPLAERTVIDADLVASRALSVGAEADAAVTSVALSLNGGSARIESKAPYALFGDKGDDLLAGGWSISAGDRDVVEIDYFAGPDGMGPTLGRDRAAIEADAGTMTGLSGTADLFVVHEAEMGRTRIENFGPGDLVHFAGPAGADEIAAAIGGAGGDAVIDFGGGNVLTVAGAAGLDMGDVLL